MARDKAGRWLPGQCPNQSGRKTGTVARYRKLLDGRAEELITAMLDAAASGDVQALRWCCDRLIPPLRAVAPPVAVNMPADVSLSEQGRALLSELASGNLSADDVASLIGALQAQARLMEVSDILPRLEQLEQKVKP